MDVPQFIDEELDICAQLGSALPIPISASFADEKLSHLETAHYNYREKSQGQDFVRLFKSFSLDYLAGSEEEPLTVSSVTTLERVARLWRQWASESATDDTKYLISLIEEVKCVSMVWINSVAAMKPHSTAEDSISLIIEGTLVFLTRVVHEMWGFLKNQAPTPRSLRPPWYTLCVLYGTQISLSSIESVDLGLSIDMRNECHQLAQQALDVEVQLIRFHTCKLVNEVFAYSYYTIRWSTGNMIPLVEGIHPDILLLYQISRRHVMKAEAVDGSDEWGTSISHHRHVGRALVCALLLGVVEMVLRCLQKHSSTMHVERVAQAICTDVPMLVLVVRLWRSWLSPQFYTEELEKMLKDIVVCAVELRERRSSSAEAECSGSNGGQAAKSEADAADSSTGELFREVVWDVAPLTASEAAAKDAAVLWCSSFVRHSSVHSILSKRVVVTRIP